MMIWFYFLDPWHQWKSHSMMSPFVIEDNTHAPPFIILFFFLSPFDINGKGISPWFYLFLCSLSLFNLMLIHLEMKRLAIFSRPFVLINAHKSVCTISNGYVVEYSFVLNSTFSFFPCWQFLFTYHHFYIMNSLLYCFPYQYAYVCASAVINYLFISPFVIVDGLWLKMFCCAHSPPVKDTSLCELQKFSWPLIHTDHYL